MNKSVFSKLIGLGVATAAFAGAANAQIMFSNVQISGTPGLIGGFSYATGGLDIDFTTPNAVVGDFVPLRDGTFTITYEAMATGNIANLIGNTLFLTIQGLDVQGSGRIRFQETIEDVVNPGFIGGLDITITPQTQFPVQQTIWFTRNTNKIKVKKTVIMEAFDTNAFDRARIGFIEQRLIVPEPATMAALGLGLAAVAARRRKKA